MSFLDFLNPINKGIDLASEFIEDKDKRNELTAQLEQLKGQIYLAELQTKTIPWVDAVHKMGRQVLSLLGMLIPAVLLYLQPEIDPLAVAAIVGPAGVYNFAKGKGR